jgi:hypothetical protein
MSLEMRCVCERCLKTLAIDGEAYICSYECTFCGACAKEMGSVCPNCQGNLVERPRRAAVACEA